MSVTETLLRECAARGVRLSASGDRLRVEVPDNLRFDDLLDNLRAHKPDLLAVQRVPLAARVRRRHRRGG